MHNKMQGLGDSSPKAIEIVERFVASVGPEATVKGLRLLGAGNLAVLVPEIDPAEVQASELKSLNGTDEDFNSRLSAMEQQL